MFLYWIISFEYSNQRAKGRVRGDGFTAAHSILLHYTVTVTDILLRECTKFATYTFKCHNLGRPLI